MDTQELSPGDYQQCEIVVSHML